MKGLVLEINDDHAAILLTDGQILKIKNKAYQIGQEIDYTLNPSKHSKGISKIVAFAALILIFFGSSAWLYSQPYYEVSVDVNPSVLLSVNAFERVIDVTYMNEEAKEALEHTSIKHKSIKKAVSYVIDDIEKAGYFSEPREIIVATAGKNIKKSQALASDLSEVIEEASEDLDQKPSLSSEALGYDMVEKARLQGITPGLYNQKLKEETLEDQDRNHELDKPGKPEDSGKPDSPGKSEDSGKPESPGKSEDSGKPESPGKSEDSGKPESPGKSEESGKPESPGKSEDRGKPEAEDELEENDGLEDKQNNNNIGKPLKPGKADKNQNPKKEDSPGNQNKSNPSSGKTK